MRRCAVKQLPHKAIIVTDKIYIFAWIRTKLCHQDYKLDKLNILLSNFYVKYKVSDDIFLKTLLYKWTYLDTGDECVMF